MRVLHVAQPVTGGVAAVVAGDAAHQARLGHDVAVACPPGALADAIRDAGLPWHRWDAVREPGRSVPGEAWRLRGVADAVRADVVHLHGSKAGLAGRLLPPPGGCVVFQPHAWSFEAVTGALAAASARWERWAAARRTDLLLWCSWDEQAAGLRAGVRGRGVVVLNGVDPGAFRPATGPARLAARLGLGLPAGVPVAVTIGRAVPQKGHDVALRARPAVRRRFPDARLLVAGDGPGLAALHAAAVPGVHLLGHAAPAPVLRAADVAVLPSRWEGLSLALVEGLAAGLPTVATDVSGSREALLAGPWPRAGAVVPRDDPDALAAAVVRRFADAALRAAEGAAARTRAERLFTRDATHDRVLEAYATALARRPGGSRPASAPRPASVTLPAAAPVPERRG